MTPCKYSTSGCEVSVIHPKELINHEDTCEFRPCPCPGASCKWHGSLASLFECPVCYDYALPPILQCQKGHLVCNNCRPKLTRCPTCEDPLGNIRSLAMEKVASNVLFPCKYSTSGCTLSLVYTKKPNHEDTCEFRPYCCPSLSASCKWQGSLEQVVPHVVKGHNHISISKGEDIIMTIDEFNQPGSGNWIRIQYCLGHHFMLMVNRREKYNGYIQFFVMVKLIGSGEQTENFVCRLELSGHKRRRLMWEGHPLSIHKGVSPANSDCLVFDTAVTQVYVDNGGLPIRSKISLA